MTVTTIDTAPTAIPTGVARGRGGGGPAPTRIVVAYGFWIFILSDIVMFSALFAAYAVLSGNTAGGTVAPFGITTAFPFPTYSRSRAEQTNTRSNHRSARRWYSQSLQKS